MTKVIKPISPNLERAIFELRDAERQYIKNLKEQLKILKEKNGKIIRK